MKSPIQVRIDPDLEELIPRFLQNRREDVEAIRSALAERDFATIARVGHSMKGSGGGYGFDLISDLGRSIETAAGAAREAEITRATSELVDYLDRVEIVFADPE